MVCEAAFRARDGVSWNRATHPSATMAWRAIIAMRIGAPALVCRIRRTAA